MSKKFFRTQIKELIVSITFLQISNDETPRNGRFPVWLSKEYVFRSLIPRPLASSRESVQRLYVYIKEKDFRCAGAFTEDVLFFTP